MALDAEDEGKAEELEGQVTGVGSHETEGKVDQAVGKAKAIAEDVRDAAGNLIGRAREEFAEHRPSSSSDPLGAITALARKVTASATRSALAQSDDSDAPPNVQGTQWLARSGKQPDVGPVRRTRMAKRKASVWTIPHGDGWANKREGAKRASKVFETKSAAQTAGRKTAMRERVEHIIANRDGQISERNSYGNDPRRSKG